MISNHQSWVDDPADAQGASSPPSPSLASFCGAVWLPFVGLGAWALDFLRAAVFQRGAGPAPGAARQGSGDDAPACERLRRIPASILNFVEGTRFTPEKHAAQRSTYRHLLMPRAGGIAFVLPAMGPQLRAVLDTTIVYPEGRSGFWDFLSGRISKVIVRARQIEIPRDFLVGDYENDPIFRERFQAWVRELWREKDELIDRLLHGTPEARRAS